MSKKARILIIDDDLGLLSAMQRMLKADFDVVATDQVHKALELARADDISALIVDLVMPEMTGIEILQQVKATNPLTEVIIVTGYASVRTAKQALRAGAYDYLERPFTRQELQHVVRNAVIHRELGEPEKEPQKNTSSLAQLHQRVRQLEGQLAVEEGRTLYNTVQLLYQLIGARQHDTMMHLRSVEDYAIPVARRLGLSEQEQESLRVAAAFHDIGKLAVDESILYKSGPLNDQEWEVMREHPVVGAQIVGTVPGWEEAAKGVLYHQERYDGKGYPEGLAGDSIPRIARIVAVADAYDAMTSERSYKPAYPRQHAIDEITRNGGGQFDPEVAEAFVAVM